MTMKPVPRSLMDRDEMPPPRPMHSVPDALLTPEERELKNTRELSQSGMIKRFWYGEPDAVTFAEREAMRAALRRESASPARVYQGRWYSGEDWDRERYHGTGTLHEGAEFMLSALETFSSDPIRAEPSSTNQGRAGEVCARFDLPAGVARSTSQWTEPMGRDAAAHMLADDVKVRVKRVSSERGGWWNVELEVVPDEPKE